MGQKNYVEKLKEIFNISIDNDLKYDGNLNDINYYSLLCKATALNKLFKMFNCNLCLFNTKYKNKDSIMMIFSIPLSLNSEINESTKHISERVMEIIKVVEDAFINVDYMKCKEVKEDKFIYLTIIKKIERKDL